MEGVKKIAEKQVTNLAGHYEDFWGRHNLTTRIGILLFVLIYAVTVMGIMFTTIDPTIAKILLDSTSYVAFLSIAMVILGSNTIVKIAKVLKN